MSAPFQRIHVIINPAAGKDEPILHTLNRVFAEHDVNWQASVTRERGEATRLAREAVASGADLVAGYGGDGTLMEIVNGLVGSDVTLGILPGGTGNGMARELGIPFELSQAAALLCRQPTVRFIDLGLLGDQYFLLHVYTGLRPSKQVDQEVKERLGILAYALQIARVLTQPEISRYSMEVDGQRTEKAGVACLITNAIGLGRSIRPLANMKVDDGLLELFFVGEEALSLAGVLPELAQPERVVQHWQGKEIVVSADPPQAVWVDGEAAGETPIKIVAQPEALPVAVP